jgi:UDP-N-acetylglucosamine--N-acetylmuramyl-(pentapeptide) pyrophosphoryl-undecaprenol N-acetylglucosamine transferase
LRDGATPSGGTVLQFRLMALAALQALAITGLSTLIPAYLARAGADDFLIGLSFTAWAVTRGGFGLIAGRAYERFGPRRLLTLALLLFSLATGGYASGPVGLAAWLLGVPLVLQEQNVVPGVTNRLLSRVAVGVAGPHAEAAKALSRRARVWVVGNPIRRELMGAERADARRRLDLPGDGQVVLMVAGSRGSAVFVRLLKEWDGPGLLYFVAGRAHYAAAKPLARDGVRVVPYLEDAGLGYAAADLVVCRAGAITLAELAAVGKPSILIPSPHVTHHHQEANAAVFAKAGAAVVLPEAGLDGVRLAAAVRELLDDPQRLRRMAEAGLQLGRPDALDELVERVHALV